MIKKNQKIIFKMWVYQKNVDAKCALILFIDGPLVF
jgi:hypothetical protein